MPNCDNCGSFVSKDFVRVFGVGGAVNGCLECKTGTEIRDAEV